MTDVFIKPNLSKTMEGQPPRRSADTKEPGQGQIKDDQTPSGTELSVIYQGEKMSLPEISVLLPLAKQLVNSWAQEDSKEFDWDDPKIIAKKQEVLSWHYGNWKVGPPMRSTQGVNLSGPAEIELFFGPGEDAPKKTLTIAQLSRDIPALIAQYIFKNLTIEDLINDSHM